MIYTVTLNPALDKTIYVDNFSLDEVNRVLALREDPGGKGINVTKVVEALGGSSEALALLGGSVGARIQQMLDAAHIKLHAFQVAGETRTNTKVVDEVRHTNTDINEPGPTVSEADLDSMLQVLLDLICPQDIVVLSGSLPAGAPADTYRAWIEACSAAGARVFLDASGEAFEKGLEAKPYLIKPNEVELGAMLGRALDTDEKVVEAARALVEDGISCVVVSRGGDGAVCVDKENVVVARSPKVKVASTVGCGDSVVAALALGADTSMELDDLLVLAMATGSANAMQSGTQPAPLELVESLKEQVTFA